MEEIMIITTRKQSQGFLLQWVQVPLFKSFVIFESTLSTTKGRVECYYVALGRFLILVIEMKFNLGVRVWWYVLPILGYLLSHLFRSHAIPWKPTTRISFFPCICPSMWWRKIWGLLGNKPWEKTRLLVFPSPDANPRRHPSVEIFCFYIKRWVHF